MSYTVPKTPPALWVQQAKNSLIANGVESVRVDRLAKQLRVTRGGFYHHFEGRDDLLDRLLQQWRKECHFIPLLPEPTNPEEAFDYIVAIAKHLIMEEDYDPLFDAAVRSWGRGDDKVARIVAERDQARLQTLTKVFKMLGYEDEEADFRGRIFYMHQLGYYQLGLKETKEERLANLQSYGVAVAGRLFREHLSKAPGRLVEI